MSWGNSFAIGAAFATFMLWLEEKHPTAHAIVLLIILLPITYLLIKYFMIWMIRYECTKAGWTTCVMIFDKIYNFI